jgi:NAD(P)-dependent dehydrogenase (short-subunit alcohol dehydrogenase family)
MRRSARQQKKGYSMGLLEGKTVLVTGGTSGIGKASAILFAKEGACVVLTGRRREEGEQVVSEITAGGGQAAFIKADLTDYGRIREIVGEVVGMFGGLDCAFNNAGVGGRADIGSHSVASWDRLVDTNAKSAFSVFRLRRPK